MSIPYLIFLLTLIFAKNMLIAIGGDKHGTGVDIKDDETIDYFIVNE